MPAAGLLLAAPEGGGAPAPAAAAAAAPSALASIQLAVGESSITLDDASDAAMADPAMAASVEVALSALAAQVAQMQARLAATRALGAAAGGGAPAPAPAPAPEPSPFAFAEPPPRPLGSLPALPNSAVKASVGPRMPRTILRHAGVSRTSGRA
jgi:hypothetical protein